jgi:alpha-tubulin suppressor-like RCC1 family protein
MRTSSRCIAAPALLALLAALTVGCEKHKPPTEPEPDPEEAPELAIATLAAAPIPFREVSSGNAHTCGVTSADKAYCWGYNGFGQVGDGTNIGRLKPVLVVGGLLFRQISAGYHHTCGVTTTDRAYCWGSNSSGQLGDGTTTNRTSPVLVAGGLLFRRISAGGTHTCAFTTTLKAYCWGENGDGQLGDGTVTDRSTPVPVAGGLAIRLVAAGRAHSCGVESVTNKAYCWGDNQQGQIGDNSVTDRLTPVPVAGNRQYRGLTAGGFHTCASGLSSTVYCWGDGDKGQLGDGAGVDRLTPVVVLGSFNFLDAEAGHSHTCGQRHQRPARHRQHAERALAGAGGGRTRLPRAERRDGAHLRRDGRERGCLLLGRQRQRPARRRHRRPATHADAGRTMTRDATWPVE